MEKLNRLSDLSTYVETAYDDRTFKRGEIYYVDMEDINEITLHVSHKNRPALIIQNNKGNLMSHTLIVALLTTVYKKDYPFQYKVTINGRESVVMFEQLLTIDKSRVLEKYAELTPTQMREADMRLMHSLELNRLSLSNVMDIEILSVVARKTRTQEEIYFEIKLIFQYNQSAIINITLPKLQQLNKSICKDTDFNELKQILDCCRGLNWLVNNGEFIET